MRTYKKTFRNRRSNSRYRIKRTKSRFSRRPTSKFNYGSAVGKYIGSAMGSYLGASKLGSKLGSSAGRAIAKVIGHGDYHVTNSNIRNTLIPPGDSPPQFSNVSNREVRIQHREYIQDVLSASGSTPTVFDTSNGPFPINPGETKTFPWLSSVAGNFECYRLNGMLFEFKTTSADALNSTNTALGTVVMATSYNAANKTFLSKQQMENYEYAQSCKPSESMCHYIECAKSLNPLSELYVRIGDIPSGQSPQLYDVGYFNIATVGMQAANVNLGELWVTYDITLFKPKLAVGGAVAGEIGYVHKILQTALKTPTAANIFGTYPSSDSYWPSTSDSTMNLRTEVNDIVFKDVNVGMQFMIILTVNGAASSAGPPTSFSGTNMAITTLFNNQVSQGVGSQTTSNFVVCVGCRVTGVTGAVRFTFGSGATFPTGLTAGDLFILQLPGFAT